MFLWFFDRSTTWDKKNYRQNNFLPSTIWKIHKLISLSIYYGRAGKYDLITNKNSKYLLYRSNDWIDSLGADKIR